MGILESKAALVTGASRGVGAAIARCLAKEGAAVVINYLKSEEKAEDVARLLLSLFPAGPNPARANDRVTLREEPGWR